MDLHSTSIKRNRRPGKALGSFHIICQGLLLLPSLGFAAVIASHSGDTNPTSEGWSGSFSSTVTSLPGAEDSGAPGCESPCTYWRINDSSTASGSTGGYSVVPTDAQFNDSGGWSLRARVKRVQITLGVAEPPSYSATLYLRSAAGGSTREFSARFGLTAAGLLQMNITGLGDYTLGSSADYQLIEIVFDPDRDAADFLVDGEVVASDFSGHSPGGAYDSIFWGSGQSSTTGQTFWHEVVFETNPDTDGDGLTDMDERRIHATNPYVADTDDDGASDGEEIAAASDPLVTDTDGDTLLDGFEIKYGLAVNVAGDDEQDTDSDGLNNYNEQLAGANPLKADTDGDGISDSDEFLVYESNPNGLDSDEDGLSDADEVNLHATHPAKFDTDDDGLGDYDELMVYLTDPNNPDSDSDGALDGQEISNYNTDPLVADSDGDGLLDGYEILYELAPLTAGEEHEDIDGDTLDHLAEQAAGTHPFNVDTDGDGINDNKEISTYGSDPTLSDTDGDGLHDGFEIQYSLAVLTAGDDIQDPDNDGLSNLEEQSWRTDPHDPDTDKDGVVDGQEVNINQSNPTLADGGKVPQSANNTLEFVANNQQLFLNPPPASRIDLFPDGLVERAMAKNNYKPGTNTFGKVVNVDGEVPLWAYQEAWDKGWAACKQTRRGSTQYNVGGVVGLFDACSDWSYTPSDSLCRDGGSIDLEAQSVSCCVTVAGDFNALASYDSCKDKSDVFRDSYVKNFTLAYVEGLYSGNQIPDTITIPQGLGNRPPDNWTPPAASYTVGAEVDVDVSLSADLLVSAESQDRGEFDIRYVTDVKLQTDNTTVIPGDTFKIWLDHKPREGNGQTHMASRWAAIGFSSGYEINGTAKATAEYWSINPNKVAAEYPNPDFQEHGTLTILDKTITETGEFIGFEAAASDRIEFRFMHGVDAEAIPDFMKDKTFEITPEIIDFNLFDVNLNVTVPPEDFIPPGTGLPIVISKCKKIKNDDGNLECPPKPCPFNFVVKGFCFGIGKVISFFKNFFNAGIAQEVVNLRFQLPEIDTPVSKGFWGGYEGQFLDQFLGKATLAEPRRSAVDDTTGKLINTVPNKLRPLTNYTDTTPLKALFKDTTLHSSDTMRLQWDMDGTFSSGGGWFDAAYGNSAISLVAGVFDIDLALWTGLDQTLTFTPGLVADLSFNLPVMVRVVSDKAALNESTHTLLNPGDIKTIPARILLSDYGYAGEPTTYLEVIQPNSDLEVSATYSFRENSFTNDTRRVVTVAPTLTVLKLGIGGLVGSVIYGATGSSEVHGPRVTLPIPAVTEVILGDKFNDQGEVVDENDPNIVIGPRSVPGQVNVLNNNLKLTILERASDTDGDGLPDSLEQTTCTSKLDMDSDDDGIGDGIEDSNRNGIVDTGETDPCNVDSDGDGIQDGTEKGAMVGIADPDGSGPLLGTDLSVFIPDPDPTIRSDPTVVNTSGGGGGGGVSSDSGGGAIMPISLVILSLLLLASRNRASIRPLPAFGAVNSSRQGN